MFIVADLVSLNLNNQMWTDGSMLQLNPLQLNGLSYTYQ